MLKVGEKYYEKKKTQRDWMGIGVSELNENHKLRTIKYVNKWSEITLN